MELKTGKSPSQCSFKRTLVIKLHRPTCQTPEKEELQLSEMLLEDLTLAISKATNLLQKMKFKKLKQSRKDDFYR